MIKMLEDLNVLKKYNKKYYLLIMKLLRHVKKSSGQ
jgi:hypothetical protein